MNNYLTILFYILCFAIPAFVIEVIFPSEVVRVYNESIHPVTLKIYDQNYEIEPGRFFRKSFKATNDGSYIFINPNNGEVLNDVGYFSSMMDTCHRIVITSPNDELVFSDDIC